MAKHKSDFGYTGDFTDWLYGFVENNKKPNKNDDMEFFNTPYCTSPEDITDDEKELYDGCKVVCFRLPGYTVGHIYVRNGVFVKAIVYDRATVNRFSIDCHSLEDEINKNWIGKKLELYWGLKNDDVS